MVVERECIVCKEDALYYCRMCLSHFCVEHLCMHLSVAQEENSYTNREIKDESKASRNASYAATISNPNSFSDDAVSDDLQSLESYSEEKLRELYYIYSNATRRIRFELESRALSTQSSEEKFIFQQVSKRNKVQKSMARRMPTPGISARRAVYILSNNLREGNISIEYIIARMNAFRK